jgi:hypothetical protein
MKIAVIAFASLGFLIGTDAHAIYLCDNIDCISRQIQEDDRFYQQQLDQDLQQQRLDEQQRRQRDLEQRLDRLERQNEINTDRFRSGRDW